MARPATSSVSKRHEDSRPYRQLKPAEPGFAGQMLQRDAAGALGHQVVEPVRGLCACDHQLAHVAGGRPQDMRGQRDGVELGTVDTGVRQGPGGCANGVAQRGGHRPDDPSATAAIRTASSVSTADCTIGSRSPSRTMARL